MSIEKYISPFIANQFPSFYQEEGPNFIAFVKAYYEWMESSGAPLHEARSLFEYLDIDTTSDVFIKNFKKTLIESIPENVVVDKRLLMKHVLELYRAKGTKRAYALLFRMIYGEDIDLYIPGNYIFKPSDNTWKIPSYIETTSHPKLASLIGTKIRNNAGATAIVESVDKKIVNGRTVNILSITNLIDKFRVGDRIYQAISNDVTSTDGPFVTGSLNAIGVTNGGSDYNIGDILDIIGSGIEGKAKVASVINDFTGSINFLLVDGGSGFSTNAIVTVKQTLNLDITDATGILSIGQKLTDATTNANGTIVFANSSLIRIVDRSLTLSFGDGNQVTTDSGSATIFRQTGGTGSGASFKVGGIRDKELVNLNTDVISNYYDVILDQTSNTLMISVSSVSGTFGVGETVNSTANSLMLEGVVISSNNVANGESLSNTTLGISGLYVYRADVSHVYVTSSTDSNLNNANIVAGTILVSNTSSSVLQLVTKPSKETITGNAVIASVTGSNLNISSVNGYFVPSKTITSNSGATANISTVTRLTDWQFAKRPLTATNLDTILDSALTYQIFEIGTIDYLSSINPGSQYTSKVYIDVIEPAVAALNTTDVYGRTKGHNATIDSKIVGGNGIITAVEIINSGYGYIDNEILTLQSAINPTLVEGSTIVELPGRGEGRWLNRKSFTSDEMKLQDSLFYQDFSYQIVAEKMMSVYENVVRTLVHPTGIALYGRYRLNDELIDDESTLIESSIT